MRVGRQLMHSIGSLPKCAPHTWLMFYRISINPAYRPCPMSWVLSCGSTHIIQSQLHRVPRPLSFAGRRIKQCSPKSCLSHHLG